MPDEPRSPSGDALARSLALELERLGAVVPLTVLKDYLRRARDGAFSEAMDVVKQVAVALTPTPSSQMAYGWNNAVSESLCRLESLRASERSVSRAAVESEPASEPSVRKEP